jgi:hypothetical protein
MDKNQEEQPAESTKDIIVQEVAAEEPFGIYIPFLFTKLIKCSYILNIIGTLLQELEYLLISHFTLEKLSCIKL